MSHIQVKEAADPVSLEKIIGLRYEILRKPWDQTFESASDNLEECSINAYAEDHSGRAIACGRLQKNDERTGQIRYMAVDKGSQGKGLGRAVLHYLERRAREEGLKTVILQARENAVPFYEAQGYTVVEKTFLLWGKIQHYLMQKTL
jgi:N-acetylglutamate synthase-like GNAT family acetyltransferase